MASASPGDDPDSCNEDVYTDEDSDTSIENSDSDDDDDTLEEDDDEDEFDQFAKAGFNKKL